MLPCVITCAGQKKLSKNFTYDAVSNKWFHTRINYLFLCIIPADFHFHYLNIVKYNLKVSNIFIIVNTQNVIFTKFIGMFMINLYAKSH
jgi:hypothetical protein